MNADCYPVTALPHVSPLFRDYVSGNWEKLRPFYAEMPSAVHWMQHPPSMEPARRQAIVESAASTESQFWRGLQSQNPISIASLPEPQPSSPASRWRCSAVRS